jgi:hypothetical protein
MYNANVPPEGELPSSRALLRSTLIAAGIALALLLTVVLPAEYGVDPTRIGSVLGLTEMGRIKVALAAEAEAASAAEAASGDATPIAAAPVPATPVAADSVVTAGLPATAAKADVAELSLAPGEGKEIKLAMREGARVTYAWSVQGGVVNYDTHADRPGVDYHGYEKGQGVASDEGVLVAAFDGMHGWFWRNRSGAPVTLTLRVEGDYQELKHLN